MLAVTLGYVESVRILLNHDADVNCESPDGWTGSFISFIDQIKHIILKC